MRQKRPRQLECATRTGPFLWLLERRRKGASEAELRLAEGPLGVGSNITIVPTPRPI